MHPNNCSTTRSEAGTYDEGFADAVAVLRDALGWRPADVALIVRKVSQEQATRILTAILP